MSQEGVSPLSHPGCLARSLGGQTLRGLIAGRCAAWETPGRGLGPQTKTYRAPRAGFQGGERLPGGGGLETPTMGKEGIFRKDTVLCKHGRGTTRGMSAGPAGPTGVGRATRAGRRAGQGAGYQASSASSSPRPVGDTGRGHWTSRARASRARGSPQAWGQAPSFMVGMQVPVPFPSWGLSLLFGQRPGEQLRLEGTKTRRAESVGKSSRPRRRRWFPAANREGRPEQAYV